MASWVGAAAAGVCAAGDVTHVCCAGAACVGVRHWLGSGKAGVGALAPKPMKGMVRGGMRDFPSIGCTLILSVVTTEPAPHLPAGMHCSTQNSTKSTTRSTPHLGCSRPLHRHGSGADNGQRHAENGRRCRCTAVCNSSTP